MPQFLPHVRRVFELIAKHKKDLIRDINAQKPHHKNPAKCITKSLRTLK